MIARSTQVFPSAENVSKVSHFLPPFRSPVGLSVAVRPLCRQAGRARRKTRGGVCRKTSKKNHSRKDITSYVSVDGALEISETGSRRKYLD